MKKVVLYTNTFAFNKDVKEYGNRTRLEKEIRDEVKRLLPQQQVTTHNFFKDSKANFYKLLAKEYPKHLELMKVEKIPGMIDMDLTKLFKLIFEYEKGDGYTNKPAPKTIKSPSIDNYRVYAESQSEIDKYNAIQKAIDALYEAEAVCGFEILRGNISQGTKGWIYANMYEQGMRFNHTYILDTRRAEAKQKRFQKV